MILQRGVGGVAQRLLKVKSLKLSLCPDHHNDDAEEPFDYGDEDDLDDLDDNENLGD